MRASNTEILIVSSMSSCLGYENILRRNNFNNISWCSDAVSALQYMEHSPVQVLVSDMSMEDMDGYELANHLRDIECSEERFTYIVLISETSSCRKVEVSSQAKVDAVISKESVPFSLIPQIMSGERIAVQTNHLLSTNKALIDRCERLEVGQLLDPLTGLGNRRQAMRTIDDMSRQIEARGGVLCLLLIKINDLGSISGKYCDEIANELITGLARKIKNLVRPLDVVTYFDKGLFAVIMQHNSIDHCIPESYERIFNGLTLKSFQTKAGFIQPKISLGACGTGAETGPPKSASIVAEAMVNLGESDKTGQLSISRLTP